MSVFADFQPAYAAHNIPTFPLKPDKHPAVRNWQRFGLTGSAALMGRFASAEALGFNAGKRSKITVADIDTPDERVLADFMGVHGKTPVISRSARGRFHAWYRHNGERRCIKVRGLPIDILGAGVVVAPPSHVELGDYRFIEGGLDDLDRLPCMHVAAPELANMREGDGRNNKLFRLVMRAARHADDFEQLLDYAQTQNSQFMEPMMDTEVVKVAGNAWGYEQRGLNRFGSHGSWSPLGEVNAFVSDPDGFMLLSFLRANNGPDSTFMVANGLAQKFGWWEHRLAAARRRLIERGHFRPVRQAGRGHPALFRWLPLNQASKTGEGVG